MVDFRSSARMVDYHMAATEAQPTPTEADHAVVAETKPCAANSDFVDPSFGDIAEDLFEQNGASTASLEEWQEAEDRLIAATSTTRRWTGPIRTLVLQKLTEFLDVAGLTKSAWFSTVSLLDHSGAQDEQDLPAVCLAIVHLLSKFERAELHYQNPMWLHKFMTVTVSGRVPLKDVKAWEHKLLANVRWRLVVPNAETWVTAFVARLDALSRNAFTPTLVWTRDHILARIRSVELETPDHGMPPRQLAIGLIGLVSAGFLPHESVLEASGPAFPTYGFPPKISQRILELLLDAICCRCIDLCSACALVAGLSQPPAGQVLLI